MDKYKLEIELIEPMLGTIPKNEEVYKTWVDLQVAKRDDETPPEFTEQKSWTGFHSDEKGLFIYDYMIKGFLKEAASILSDEFDIKRKGGEALGVATIKRHMDNLVFVFPRRIYVGKAKPDGFIERPLRAKTMQGDRVALARSDKLDAGTKLSCEIWVLSKVREKTLKSILDYGALKGLGQWRNGGYGRFHYELTSLATVG